MTQIEFNYNINQKTTITKISKIIKSWSTNQFEPPKKNWLRSVPSSRTPRIARGSPRAIVWTPRGNFLKPPRPPQGLKKLTPGPPGGKIQPLGRANISPPRIYCQSEGGGAAPHGISNPLARWPGAWLVSSFPFPSFPSFPSPLPRVGRRGGARDPPATHLR